MQSCPICSKPLNYAGDAEKRRLMPFCSARCKMIDLGAWMSEEYRVPSHAPLDQMPEEEGDE